MTAEYGYAREQTEGQIYLMKRMEERPNWAIAVAAFKGGKANNSKNWNKKNFPLYSVLWSDVKSLEKDLAERLLEIN